jgi:hypothetical protein
MMKNYLVKFVEVQSRLSVETPELPENIDPVSYKY